MPCTRPLQAQTAALGFGDHESIERFTNLFSTCLPFGFIGMPLIGYFLDHLHVQCARPRR